MKVYPETLEEYKEYSKMLSEHLAATSKYLEIYRDMIKRFLGVK